MPELRWALFGLGALFIVGLAVWEWRRSRRRHSPSADYALPTTTGASEDWSRRIEPRIDSLLGSQREAPLPEAPDFDDEPMHSNEPVSVPVAREMAVDRPSAARPELVAAPAVAVSTGSTGMYAMPKIFALDEDPVPDAPGPDAAAAAIAPPSLATAAVAPPAIQWPPQNAERVLTLRIVNAQGAPLAGRAVRIALEQFGLVFGPQRIFHRVNAQGAVLASCANLVRPGDLDPAELDVQQLRGLSMFSVLPGALAPARTLAELVALARAIATRLGAVVQDEQGQELTADRLQGLRQSLPVGMDGI